MHKIQFECAENSGLEKNSNKSYIAHTFTVCHGDCSLFHSHGVFISPPQFKKFEMTKDKKNKLKRTTTTAASSSSSRSNVCKAKNREKNMKIHQLTYVLKSTCDATVATSITCRIYLCDASTVLFYKFTLFQSRWHSWAFRTDCHRHCYCLLEKLIPNEVRQESVNFIWCEGG